jgi:DNA ligase-1
MTNKKRMFLMKAHKKEPKHKIDCNWTWSIKLDGIRAFWDGGLTRNYPVPWDGQETSTGLFSINGNVIHAPDWFLDNLPKRPLDGELWAGPGNFQLVSSIVRKDVPIDSEWESITYMVFDFPGLVDVFWSMPMLQSSTCKVTCTKELMLYIEQLCHNANMSYEHSDILPSNFKASSLADSTVSEWVQQRPVLTYSLIEDQIFPELLEKGHEGVVFRHRDHVWQPFRSHQLIKLKPFLDSEALVTGCTFGRDTDKGGKLLGKMGALICRWQDKEFLLSGFTDIERALTSKADFEYIKDYAILHQGETCPDYIFTKAFPPGTVVSFKYRELSNDGIPKDARYWRKFEAL